MQNKGGIKFLTIVLAIACLYQLSFTLVTSNVEKNARKAANGDPIIERNYLDSIKSEPVYDLGFIKYTYSECKDKEINLGLDLKGGMNVTLQISVRDVLVALSNNTKDVAFNQAIEMATEKQKNSRADYITLFEESYKEIAPAGKLSTIFSTYDLREQITPGMSNAEVIKVLRTQAESAISNSFNVLRSRIDRFGVTQPNIQRLENSGRILVELPGVKEPERVRKLLQGTASLEFWATYSNTEVFPMLQQVNQRLSEVYAAQTSLGNVAVIEKDSMTEVSVEKDSLVVEKETDIIAELPEAKKDSTAVSAEMLKNNPLFALLNPAIDPQSGQAFDAPIVGYAHVKDTSAINAIFDMEQIKSLLPRTLKLMWGVKAFDKEGNTFELYAINGNTKDGKPLIDGGSVVDARPEYSQYGSTAEVTMAMNPTGSRIWARMTSDNIGKSIAIVLDGYVYSAPRVQTEISGGRSSITGDFTINEATDLANVLKSGKLPAPARIIQEAVVGPTLGQESIDTGMMSFILAFILVLLYMIFYYHGAGLVACIALILNLFFLFGVLASFGAVLTLPGIAGIVLTMGMAVDANVIIYERIKEELRAGKALSLSIADGYKNAYSAIIDGQATTLITGIVLFIFGSGPVQGFATTLVIGIITSLFCAIFITKMVFVAYLNKGKNISFSNKWTKNMMSNVHFDFIGKRKFAYIISGAMILITIISLSTRGLSYGVDFSGGRAYVIRFDSEVTANSIREAITNPEFKAGLEVKQFGEANQMRITTQYKFQEEGETVTDEINTLLYEQLKSVYKAPLTKEEFTTNIVPYGIVSSDKVGPTVAHDITINSFIAVLFSLIAIGIYIALRFKKWQWAMGGVLSLFHDALITIGAFSLFHSILPFELDINQAFIAAILTIIGYSINDTVVIFDRIREYNFLYPKRDIAININSAINSTLARTINTAGTTLVVLLAIFIFGGEVIRGFIFALTFGVVIGTYSSIFVATPIAYDFIMRKKNKKQE
ncbi:MAG: protein translocase subunit SecDF [Rikenellaceae bacterium]